MVNIDYAIAVELLLGPGIKYGSAKTYQILKQTWTDETPCPDQQPLDDIYIEHIQKEQLKHPYYYKWQNEKWILDTSKKQELRTAIDNVYDTDADGDFSNEFFLNCKKIAQESKTQEEFQLALYNNLKTKAESNETRKNVLASKTMQELMDIYNSITE